MFEHVLSTLLCISPPHIFFKFLYFPASGTMENVIPKLKNEINFQKQEILEFQKTFMQMRAEIYKLRAENKTFKLNYVQPETKDKESIDPKENKSSKNKDSETQTEATIIEKESNNFGKSGKEMFKHINCKYFYKNNGCKRGSYCW